MDYGAHDTHGPTVIRISKTHITKELIYKTCILNLPEFFTAVFMTNFTPLTGSGSESKGPDNKDIIFIKCYDFAEIIAINGWYMGNFK